MHTVWSYIWHTIFNHGWQGHMHLGGQSSNHCHYHHRFSIHFSVPARMQAPIFPCLDNFPPMVYGGLNNFTRDAHHDTTLSFVRGRGGDWGLAFGARLQESVYKAVRATTAYSISLWPLILWHCSTVMGKIKSQFNLNHDLWVFVIRFELLEIPFEDLVIRFDLIWNFTRFNLTTLWFDNKSLTHPL